MAHRHIFEAFERMLRDLAVDGNRDIPFGGKVVVFGGDFRQCLPIVVHGGRADQVTASLTYSPLWKHVRMMTLTINMRIAAAGSRSGQEFGKWLMRTGNGTEQTYGDDYVALPEELHFVSTDDELIEAIYPGLGAREFNAETTTEIIRYFNGRTILSPYNEEVDAINEVALQRFCRRSPDRAAYISTDWFVEDEACNMPQVPTEFLNKVSVAGLPEHVLHLAEGCPIILLRNLNHAAGLCNGTRLIISDLKKDVIIAQHANGELLGDTVYIPRIDLTPENTELSFKFTRRQFPVRLAFAMTINKAQGQTFDRVGLDLDRYPFGHGQL